MKNHAIILKHIEIAEVVEFMLKWLELEQILLEGKTVDYENQVLICWKDW
jgi:hypothetical protein